jgi:UDP-N-acetylglucosamine 2-epimerase (non-hydrolysing)
MKKIAIVAGARPNFMKIAPVLRVLKKSYMNRARAVLIHTGQHYDTSMSGSFFADLGIPAPDHNLNIGSGTHAEQTGHIMIEFERVCLIERPDIVIVVGDVNSTVAAALTAKKMHIELGHIEAGLRSGDRTMPEEINRLATDAISDHFFVTERSGITNLKNENHSDSSIHFVGHVMVDNLLYQRKKLEKGGPSSRAVEIKSRIEGPYACLTLHRPSNVDSCETAAKLLRTMETICEQLPIVFPCHPRTKQRLDACGLLPKPDSRICVTEPLGYDDFLYLWEGAKFVLTDSGGLQEETTALGIPCLTLRNNTERPVTVEIGSNTLVGTDHVRILTHVEEIMSGRYKKGSIPDLWDGKASQRICSALLSE